MPAHRDDEQSALEHNPECRRKKHRNRVPCRGGIKNQTRLQFLPEPIAPELHLESSNSVDGDQRVDGLPDAVGLNDDLDDLRFGEHHVELLPKGEVGSHGDKE